MQQQGTRYPSTAKYPIHCNDATGEAQPEKCLPDVKCNPAPAPCDPRLAHRGCTPSISTQKLGSHLSQGEGAWTSRVLDVSGLYMSLD